MESQDSLEIQKQTTAIKDLEDYIPGKASEVILPFVLRPGQKVCLVIRKSTRDQGPSEAQERYLRAAVEKEQAEVVRAFQFTGSGSGAEWLQELANIATYARQHGAIMLAATTDRFVRHPNYRSTCRLAWKLQATAEQLALLKSALGDVPLMTVLDPDASPERCRSLLTTWGKDFSGNPGGRPLSLRERRKRFLPIVIDLAKEGLSRQKISDTIIARHRLRIPPRTISRWLLADKQGRAIPSLTGRCLMGP